MKFYLAGPFFNKPQLDLIQQIELLFCDAGIACFSPRTAHSDKTKTEIKTPEQAKAVFNSNVENIDDCTHMLAIVDWLLPEEDKIEQIHWVKETGQIIARPISIPDSGTVWEMGYAHCREIDIILFRTKPTKLNLMLAQCVNGIITGIDQLKHFLTKPKHGLINWEAMSPVAIIMKQESFT